MCVCTRVGLRVRACRGRFLGLGFLRAGSASVVVPRTVRSCPVRSRASFMIVFAFHGYVFICLLSLSLSSLIMSSLHHLVTLVRSDDEIGFIAPFGLPLDGVVCIHGRERKWRVLPQPRRQRCHAALDVWTAAHLRSSTTGCASRHASSVAAHTSRPSH